MRTTKPIYVEPHVLVPTVLDQILVLMLIPAHVQRDRWVNHVAREIQDHRIRGCVDVLESYSSEM